MLVFFNTKRTHLFAYFPSKSKIRGPDPGRGADAGRTQEERDEVLRAMRMGELWALICTDVMSRGTVLGNTVRASKGYRFILAGSLILV